MSDPLAAALELRVTSDRANALAEASRQVQEYLERRGISARARYAADLAVEELGTNILAYGFAAGETAAFDLRATVTPDAVGLCFEDQGRPFDPTAAPPPKRCQSLAEVAIGGLGIAMVRRLVTRMTYARVAGRNQLQVDIARAD